MESEQNTPKKFLLMEIDSGTGAEGMVGGRGELRWGRGWLVGRTDERFPGTVEGAVGI